MGESDCKLDPKFDWYQNATHVFVTFTIKAGNPNNLLEVEYGRDTLVATHQGTVLAHLYLSNLIASSACDFVCRKKKIDFKLKKATDNVNWPMLERLDKDKDADE